MKNESSATAIGFQSVRPTWFEDFAVPKGPTLQTDQGQPQPLHGLKLAIKEEVLPMKDQPVPSTSITGLTWLACTECMEMQTSAGQPQGNN